MRNRLKHGFGRQSLCPAHFQQKRRRCPVRLAVPENAQTQTFSASDPMKPGLDFIDDALVWKECAAA
ncbi:MAG: hypothetical protein K2P95_02580, partial [Hyphomonadaceae bacterium]|nr:hypothetical protein [Hyphomonadaceae bacterium]